MNPQAYSGKDGQSDAEAASFAAHCVPPRDAVPSFNTFGIYLYMFMRALVITPWMSRRLCEDHRFTLSRLGGYLFLMQFEWAPPPTRRPPDD